MDMKKSKYLYARAQATLIDDDFTDDSICVPVKSLRGALYVAANLLAIFIENPKQYASVDTANTGSIVLQINSNTHTDVFESLSKAIAVGEKELIILGDDVTSEYINSNIVGVISITIDAS